MSIKVDHGLVEGIKRFFEVVLLGNRQTGPMFENLPNLEVFKVESVAFSKPLLPNLYMRRIGEFSHTDTLRSSHFYQVGQPTRNRVARVGSALAWTR